MIPLISTLGFRAGRWFRHARRLGPSRPPIYWHGEALERRLLLAVEPVGGEFRVNTTAATQVFPAVAMDPVGDFVVTWTDASGPYVQRYDSAGVKRGSEFRVTDATNGWDPPNVAMSAVGSFVVTWPSLRQDGSVWDIYAERFDAGGASLGGTFRVNSTTTATQRNPEIAMDADGAFVLAWQSGLLSGRNEVYARRYDSDGLPQGGEFPVNSATERSQSLPAVAMDVDGDFVVTWTEGVNINGGNTDQDVFARRYDPTGVPQGPQFRVNSTGVGWQGLPTVAMDAVGGFVVAWDSYLQDGSETGVYAQRYSAAGAPKGGEFRVNRTTSGNQTGPMIAMDAAGDFVVAWTSRDQDGSEYGVYAQRYSTEGVAQRGELRVNGTTAKRQIRGGVAMDAAGDFVMTWSSYYDDDNGAAVYAQRYQQFSNPSPASVGGSVWSDSNADGIRDTGEPGTDGVAVGLFNEFGAMADSAVTAGDGSYRFDDLRPSTSYYLAFVPPPGEVFTVPDQGANDALDSDADQVSGRTPAFALAPNEVDLTRDAGFTLPASVSGVVFNDHDGNGVRDSQDEGLPGWFIYLDVNGDGTLNPGEHSGTTDLSGAYSFGGLPPGTHRMAEVGQPHWLQTMPLGGSQNVLLAPGQGATGINFGNHTSVLSPPLGPVGPAMRVDIVHQGSRPATAMNGSGDFVVVWQGSDEIGSVIYAQRYDVGGEPSGGEFRVSTTYGMSPAVASDAAGDFVVAWIGRAADGSYHHLYARRYKPSGEPLGGETMVSTSITSSTPAVAMDTDGDFVLAWPALAADGSTSEVHARRYAAGGDPIGGEFRVNTTPTANFNPPPAIATDSAGAFVVAWNDGQSIYVRRYDPAGQPLGEEFLAVEDMGQGGHAPSVAMAANGEFIVTSFTSARRYDAEGQPIGTPFRILSAVAAVAMDPDGDFVIVRSGSYFGYGGGVPAMATRYNAAGQPISAFKISNGSVSPAAVAMDAAGEFVVAWWAGGVYAQRFGKRAVAPPSFRVATTAGNQSTPAVAMDATGDSVVAFQGEDGSGYGIYAQRYGADGQPLGGRFLVNATTAYTQVLPAVAMDAAGDFIIAWESISADGSQIDVHVQRYGAAGQPLGAEFGVTATIDYDYQVFPAVAMDASGEFIICWDSQDTSGYGVYAQRYGADGQPLGGKLQVNTTTDGDQLIPSVAMDANGDFIVAWERNAQDGYGVYAQRYGAGGQPLGGELRVNTDTPRRGNEYGPVVAMDGAGEFVVAWTTVGQDGSGYGVYARRYSPTGEPRGGEFGVNTTTAGRQWAPAVAMDAGGDFVIAWQGVGEIDAQRYSAAGQPVGGEFRVGATTEGYPTVAIDGRGDFLVAWQSFGADGDVWRVHGQRYGTSGQRLGSEFLIAGSGPPSVALDGSGDFVVVWVDNGVLAERYGADGRPLDAAFRVDATTSGDPTGSSVAMDANGDFIIAWTSDGQDESGWDIYARRYGATGQPLGSEFRINTAPSNPAGPSVAMDASGRFVVAWTGGDGSGDGIFARYYDETGQPFGDQFRVNTSIVGDQTDADVAIDSSGAFVIVWQTVAPVGVSAFAQRYDVDGSRAGDEVQVSAADGALKLPSVAIDSAGDFVVAWVAYADDGATHVFVRRYSPTGRIIGDEIMVNTLNGDPPANPSLAMGRDGDFVVIWQSGTYSQHWGVYAQRFSADGRPLRDQIAISATAGLRMPLPSVAMDSNGDFVVAWQTFNWAETVIYARRYGEAAGFPHAQVFLSGTGWTSAFKNALQTRGVGDASLGYAVTGSPLPWGTVNQITLRLQDDVALWVGDLAVLGLNAADYPVSNFTYDRPNRTATWTLAQSIQSDKLLLDLSPDVTGRQVPFRANVLAGDATRDGRVNALDLADVKRRLNSTTTSNAGAGYSPFADVNGDGRINALDLAAVKQRLNSRLPEPPTQIAVAAAATATASLLRASSPTRELFATGPILI